MSDNLLVINILVIIFYLLVEKLKIDEDIKKWILCPLRIIFVILAVVDLLALFGVLLPFI